MIVRLIDRGYQISFHSAHALLAQELANHLRSSELPRWFQTCAAITMHDDQKVAFQAGGTHYLTAAGATRDFTLMALRDDTRLLEARRQIDEARRKHRWIGLLVSLHVDFLYRDGSKTSEMQAFLDGEQERRRSALSNMNVDEQLLRDNYQIMLWCDRCSLILCGNDIPAMQRRLEITNFPQLGRTEIWQDEDNSIHIVPWPFEHDAVDVSIEQRILKALVFQDDAQLWQSLMDCTPSDRIFHLRR